MKRLTFALCAVCFLAIPAFKAEAADAATIRKNMAARLPALTTMKKAGQVGEDNRGYLVVRKDAADVKAAVEAENKDRKTVYEAIAAQQKATVEQVGSRRAKQIAERAAAGEWLQKEDGAWYQK